jgi:hypothetical protein
MDSSYTNPYGAQPSIPSGGQDPNAWPPVSDPSASPAQPQYAAPAEPVAIEPAQPQYGAPVEPAQPQYTAPEPYQPAAYQQPQYSQFGDSYANEQGDIVLSTSATTKKLTPKRILILAGVALAVVLLFAIVILSIAGKNKAASEAKAADRNEKLAVLENLYKDYNSFLSYYGKIGYKPTETMADEINDFSKLFIMKRANISMLEGASLNLEEDFEQVASTDFSALGSTINEDANAIIAEIKPDLGNMKININTLRAFYDAFILPVQDDLDESTATSYCSFSVTDVPGLTLDGFDVENAIANYNLAYCAVNDAIYYGTFNGYFDSSYVSNAKESLVKALLNTSDQSGTLEKLKNLLNNLGSEAVKEETEDGSEE